MRSLGLFLLVFGLFLFAVPSSKARAEDTDTGARRRPLRAAPECNWSTMSSQEFERCQKEREHLESETPRERALEAREKRETTVVTTGPNGQTLRRARPKRGHR